MPAYNAEKYISEAIQSILRQNYANWELIIVNDGSTDNTVKQIHNFKDKRIKLIDQNNKGQSAAANFAFKMSSGELIKFMDADDILSDEFLQNQYDRLDAKTDCVVSAKWGRFYNDDLNTFKLSPESVWKDMESNAWLIESWKNARPMMQCALWLIPRRIIQASGLWDENLSLINDFDFFTRVLINSKNVLFEPNALLYYRSGVRNSLSGRKGKDAYLSAYNSIKKGTYALLGVNNSSSALLSCANIWQQFIFDVFPQCPDLTTMAQHHLHKLPAPTIRFQCGGYTKLLDSIVGWKITKQIKYFLTKITCLL